MPALERGERQPLLEAEAGGRHQLGSIGPNDQVGRQRRGHCGRTTLRMSSRFNGQQNPLTPTARCHSILLCRSGAGLDVVSTSFGPLVVEQLEEHSSGAKICLGVTLAILSGLLFTFTNFLFQYLKMNPTEALAVRSVLQILLLGTILVCTCKPFYPGTCTSKALLSLQGLCSSLRVGCALSSMTYIPLGDALAIIFTEPIWTLLLTKVFLGSKISLRKLLFCLLLVAGAVLVIKPPGIFPAPSEEAVIGEGDPSYVLFIGTGLALGAAISGAMQNVLIAKLSLVPAAVHLVHSGIGGLVLSLAYSLLDSTDRLAPDLITSIPINDWLLLSMIGMLGLLGFGCLVKALQLVPPTTVAVLRAMELVVAFGLQAAVTSVLPDHLDMVGAGLVILGVMATALEENLPSWKLKNLPSWRWNHNPCSGLTRRRWVCSAIKSFSFDDDD